MATRAAVHEGVSAQACRSSRCRASSRDPGVSATAALAGVPVASQDRRRGATRDACSSSAPASCARRAVARAAHFLFRASGSAGGDSRSRCTRAPAVSSAFRTACTGTTPSSTHSSRSGRRAGGESRRSSSRACRGGRGGATPSAGGDTCTGTRARCCRSCSAAAASAGLRAAAALAVPRRRRSGPGRRRRGARVSGGLAVVRRRAAGDRSHRGRPRAATCRRSSSRSAPPRSAPASVTNWAHRGRPGRRWSDDRRRRRPSTSWSAPRFAAADGPRRGRIPRRCSSGRWRAAMRGIDVPHWVVGHGVDDVVPGVYRWPDLDAPLRPGPLRDELERICLDQTARGRRRVRRHRGRSPTPTSTTAATATRSSRPGWSRAGCTWRRTPWAPPRPG